MNIRKKLTIGVVFISLSAFSQTYVEKLSRGVVAVPSEKGNFVSWRYLSTDDPDATFDVLRDGKVIAEGLTGATSFTDKKGDSKSRYSIITHQRGASEMSNTVNAWAQPYMSIPLDRPADGITPDGQKYSYSPNDCSVGDVDGDGEYEIFLKWDPSNAHDNAHNGYTGNVLIDCLKMDGTRLWRVDLGKNIRAGAHYTQFLVYDFDGDGKVEMICKTAPGSVDGIGNFVTKASPYETINSADNSANYVNENGRILSGPEYLTVFAGQDGHAINTINYWPNRAFGVGGNCDYDAEGWGDHAEKGNRGERFLAGVAFLGGKTQNPSAVMCRGYYTKAYLWAVDFDGKELIPRWLHCSETPNYWKVINGDGAIVAEKKDLEHTAFGQGAHSLSVGDVDGDGSDEICFGSAAVDHDGTLLYSTGFGHGDAQHLGDFDHEHPGLEYFMVHEAKPYGSDFRDARTGEVLYRDYDEHDTGRGLCADIDSLHEGAEFWCSASKVVHDVHGNTIAETKNWTPQNFRIYWDGDLYDELLGNGKAGMKPGSPMFGGPRPPKDGKRPPMMPRDSLHQQMQPKGGPMGKMPRMDYYIAKWNGTGCDHIKINGKDLSEWGNSSSCNGTKATPCLQADLFGDWREEIILYDASDNAHLNVFSTNIPTQYRIPTLMSDHIYRMAVAWQNVCYNQPPHLGYNIVSKYKGK